MQHFLLAMGERQKQRRDKGNVIAFLIIVFALFKKNVANYLID